MRPFQPYHFVWLDIHPHRSPEWLRERLADGFDIHHVDGNHDNNEPANLALMEQTDHLRLHGVHIGKMLRQRHKIDHSLGEAIYNEYCSTTKAWIDLSKEHGHQGTSWALAKAKRYAEFAGKQWPVNDPAIKRGKLAKPKPRKVGAYYKMMAESRLGS